MSEIPDNVLAFVREHIDSVEQLEMLLLLKSQPEKHWTAEDVSRALSTQPHSAESRLRKFHALGLLIMKVTNSEIRQYQYRDDGPFAPTMEALADCYAKYRVRLINLIYSKPIDKIRTFADAFKLRKEDE